jgi:hypothetical protein
MIKKLLSLYLFTGIIGLATSFGQASCSPGFSCLPVGATEGICPDSATGIPSSVLGSPYSTSISIKIPASYTYMGTPYNLTHLGVTEVKIDTATTTTPGTYYPLSVIGLSYSGNGTNTPSGGASGISGYTMNNFSYWPAPGNACVVVSGTPTKAGTFPIKILSYVRVNIGIFAWLAAPDNTDYRMVVAPTAGIEELDLNKFAVKQNVPNPFNYKSEIIFSSLTSTDVDFKIYNMLGKVVISKTVKAEKGSNTIPVDASTLSPGIYVYALKNGDKTITKRMIVSNK